MELDDMEHAVELIFEQYADGEIADDELSAALMPFAELSDEFGIDGDDFIEMIGRAASNMNCHTAAGRALGFT